MLLINILSTVLIFIAVVECNIEFILLRKTVMENGDYRVKKPLDGVLLY